MMLPRTSSVRITSALLCLLSGLSAAGNADATSSAPDLQTRIERAVSHLSSLGSRVAGYPGCDLAATFVEQQFQEIGLEQVHREPFDIVVPIDHGSHLELSASGERFELHALWPNSVRTTTIAPPGHSGELIYGGTGTWVELNGYELEDSVVLLEFNSADRWLEVASLGARAVIFIAPEATSNRQALEKYSGAPLDVPRFWINRPDGIELRRRLTAAAHAGDTRRSLSIQLHSRMDWEQRQTWNILGTISGSDPDLSTDTIVLQAYYDGTSVAPGLAPSSEASASIVALIELARYLQHERPSRTIIFVATSAHFQGQQGIVDFIQRHARRHSTYAERLPEPLDIELFVSLDLSTGTNQLGVWDNTFGRYDYRAKLSRFFAPIARVFVEEAKITARRQGRDPATALVNGVSPIKGFTWGSYMPQGLQSDARIALIAGLPSLTIATVNDARIVLDTPLDDGSHLHLPNLTRQVELLGPTVQRALAAPQLLATADELRGAIHDELRNLRIHARSFPRRSQTPDRPVAEALVTMRRSYWVSNGVKPTRVYMTDSSGAVEVPGLRLGIWEAAAYAVDPATGAVTYAPDLSKRAEAHHGKPAWGGYLHFDVRWSDTVDRTIVLFPTLPQEIYSLIHPRSMLGPGELTVVDANDVAPRQFGYNIDGGMTSVAAVLFGAAAPEEKDRLKILLKDMPLLNTSPGTETADHGFGRGYLATEGPLTHTTYGAAVDLWRVDEIRLQTMREHAIESAHLQQLHDEAETQIEAAKRSRQALAWDRYIAHARAALGIESRAYPRILATLNDVIKGVLFFLALLIPAALFGERLLFAATDIRWQLTGFGALMLVIWAVLSMVHPAFDLAHPLVIVLAFSIMAMAAFVIFMVASRFSSYAEQYKSVIARVHTADFSRVGALYVAFMLGVSNMRRRRLRTGLTLATLTLLTFSMLSFTSFEDRIRFVSVPLGHEAAREGILLRKPTWHQLEFTLLDHVGSHFGSAGIITPRSWYRSSVGSTIELISVSAGEDRHTTAVDMVGLMPVEDEVTRFSNALAAGSFFESADEQTCLLPEKIADALGISAADVGKVSVRVLGSDLLVRGIVHAAAVDELLDLDGGTLMPVDARLSTFTELETDYDELREVESQAALRSFIHHSAADVLILPYEVLRGLGGRMRSIGIRFHEGTAGQQLIEDFLSRVNTGLYAGLSVDDSSQPEVYHYRSFGLGSVEDLGALAVPILIASLIILNTMLGAVYERFREIGIYSSVGLAPMHIAFLFIAEACVYAVLGVTLGYVLGQTLGKILLAFDMLQGIDLNYSSSSGVAAALLVMAVVLLSTVYPARIAARAAVPDTVRRWRPPPPDGDQWHFAFPFNIGSSEVVATCGFLHSYLASFMGAAAGDIYTEDVRLSQDDTGNSHHTLHFTQWLSPYDLGVSQQVRIEFGPTETPGLYTIHICIDRISGESFHWRRLNPRFFSMLRKQLLIWNALGQEARQDHAARALEVLQDQEVAAAASPDVDEQPVDAAPQDSAISPREATGEPKSPFSMRGLLLGTVLSFIIGSGVTYGALVLQGSWLQNNASSPAAIFLFFIVTAILNIILGAIRQRFALSRADLVLIYVMMLMAVTVPNQGFVGYVFPIANSHTKCDRG